MAGLAQRSMYEKDELSVLQGNTTKRVKSSVPVESEMLLGGEKRHEETQSLFVLAQQVQTMPQSSPPLACCSAGWQDDVWQWCLSAVEACCVAEERTCQRSSGFGAATPPKHNFFRVAMRIV